MNTLRPSPRFESSLLVNVLLVSMPESRVVESWLFCRSEPHRDESFDSWPSKRTVFFRRSVYRRLSLLYALGSSRLVPALRLPLWLPIRLTGVFTLLPLLMGAVEPDRPRPPLPPPPPPLPPLFQYGLLDCAKSTSSPTTICGLCCNRWFVRL